jgi:hypothetical protein
MSTENSKWSCIHCKKIMPIAEAKEHAKLGDPHACYPHKES